MSWLGLLTHGAHNKMTVQDILSSEGISAQCQVQSQLLRACLFRLVGVDVCPGYGVEGWLGRPQACDPL